MYRLMKSVKLTLDHVISGPLSSYRQRMVGLFRRRRAALGACEAANGNDPGRYYVLNDSGQEYFRGT